MRRNPCRPVNKVTEWIFGVCVVLHSYVYEPAPRVDVLVLDHLYCTLLIHTINTHELRRNEVMGLISLQNVFSQVLCILAVIVSDGILVDDVFFSKRR
jgi:hypothetical protein